ncbi:MAG: DUF4249 family protein [bacterium]
MNAISPVKPRQQPFHRCFIALLVVWLKFITGCSTDPVVVDPSAFEKLYVFGVLSPSSKQQEIYLSVTQFEGNPKPVNDARVCIVGAAGEINLALIGNGLYRDQNSRLQVAPGNTYQLHIKLSNGNEVNGKTTIPTSFRILRPATGDSFKVEQVSPNTKLIRPETNWTIASGSWLTRVTAYYYSASGKSYPTYNRLTTSPFTRLILTFPTTSLDPFISISLHIAQYDSALTIYTLLREAHCYDGPYENPFPQITCTMIRQWQSFYQNRGINVTGAQGLFGAVVADSVRFYIKP